MHSRFGVADMTNYRHITGKFASGPRCTKSGRTVNGPSSVLLLFSNTRFQQPQRHFVTYLPSLTGPPYSETAGLTMELKQIANHW